MRIRLPIPTVLVAALCGLASLASWAGCADRRVDANDLARMEHERALDPDSAPVLDPSILRLTEFEPYRVQPGDVLTLTLLAPAGRGEPASGDAGAGLPISPYRETVTRVRVANDGTIRLPLVGAIPAAGLDLVGLEEAIVAAHVPRYLKELSVFAELADGRRTTAMILGTGTAPLLVQLRNDERNILYALARAGLSLAQITGRVVHRPARSDAPETAYNVFDPVDIRRVLLAPPLESGDMIVLEPAPASATYVIGLVNAPGAIPVPPGSSMTVMRAIASAGGLVDFLAPGEATLWRRLKNGEQVRARIDLAALTRGDAIDVALRPGDVLEVPHTLETRLKQWVLENLRAGPFSVGVHYDPLHQYNINRALRDSEDDGLRGAIRDSLRFGVTGLGVPQVLGAP